MNYPTILILHLIGATIWTGGHLILALGFLPKALQQQDPEPVIRFESVYEKIALPALLLQVLTGFWLAHLLVPDVSDWFSLKSPLTRLITFKLVLLLLTLALAVDARLRLIPNLTAKQLTALAWHILPVTLISVLFVVVGVMFRFGGF